MSVDQCNSCAADAGQIGVGGLRCYPRARLLLTAAGERWLVSVCV